MKRRGGRRRAALLTTLRRSAAELTPVVVDLGPALPRLASFAASLEEGGGPWLILAPIADAGIPVLGRLAGAVKVRSQDHRRPWVLQADRIHSAGPGRARVGLDGAALSASPRPPALADERAQEPLVMALAAGTEELDGYTFPVVELGPDHCTVETTAPLEPGRTFAPAELFGALRVIRQATATVLETTAWLAADGSRRFRCRLRLDEGAAPPAARSYDVLSDPRRVLRILDLAAVVGVRGWYEGAGWGRDGLRVVHCRDAQLAVELDGAQPDRLPVPARITVGFELFAISYEMEMRVLRWRGREMALALPLVLRRRRRRREERAFVRAQGDTFFRYRDPLSGREQRHPVRDLSLGGLCLELPPGALVWKGFPLERGVLCRGGQRVKVRGAVVRGVESNPDGVRCHVELGELDPRDLDRLGNWMASSRHPELHRHDGDSFRRVFDLYRRAGLLAEYMIRNLESLAPTAAAGWRRLHAGRADVAWTFVQGDGEALAAAITSVHAWERTWFTQHFGATSTAGGRVSGALQVVNVEQMLAHRNAHYMAFFVNAANAAMTAFQTRFLDLTGTPEAVSRTSFDLWTAPAAAVGAEVAAVRPLRPSERLLICRAAERTFGSLAARALSFRPDELSLPGVASDFRRAGLTRTRTVSAAVDRRDVPAWALLQEQSSPGINLTWMLDAWWLLPVHPEGDSDGAVLRAALRRVLAAAPPTPAGDQFLITDPSTAPVAALEEAGFRRLLRANLFVLTRSGVHRYHHYLADRYGEVSTKTARRDLLRARGERG